MFIINQRRPVCERRAPIHDDQADWQFQPTGRDSDGEEIGDYILTGSYPWYESHAFDCDPHFVPTEPEPIDLDLCEDLDDWFDLAFDRFGDRLSAERWVA